MNNVQSIAHKLKQVLGQYENVSVNVSDADIIVDIGTGHVKGKLAVIKGIKETVARFYKGIKVTDGVKRGGICFSVDGEWHSDL